MGTLNKSLVQTSSFKSDFKKIARSGRYKVEDFQKVVTYLLQDETLPHKYHDHQLIGNWEGFRECHIKPDWLLIYRNTPDALTLVRMGSHSDLFD